MTTIYAVVAAVAILKVMQLATGLRATGRILDFKATYDYDPPCTPFYSPTQIRSRIMNHLCKTLVLVLTFACMQTVNAGVIPYANSGTENPVTYTFTAAASGDVIGYFAGTGASFTEEVALLVNGVQTAAGFGLNNQTSSIGAMFNFGHANAGDTLVFKLNVISTGDMFFSDTSMNTDGKNHVYSTSYGGTGLHPSIPAGTYVAFEDLLNGGDFNYFDDTFVFTNVSQNNTVPEPSTFAIWTLLAGSIGMIWTKRRKATSPA